MTGFHSVIESPDSVNLVNPPSTTIPNTRPEVPINQYPISFCDVGFLLVLINDDCSTALAVGLVVENDRFEVMDENREEGDDGDDLWSPDFVGKNFGSLNCENKDGLVVGNNGIDNLHPLCWDKVFNTEVFLVKKNLVLDNMVRVMV